MKVSRIYGAVKENLRYYVAKSKETSNPNFLFMKNDFHWDPLSYKGANF